MFGIVGVVERVEGGEGLLVDDIIAIVGRGFIGCHCLFCLMSISCGDDDEYRKCWEQALGGWYSEQRYGSFSTMAVGNQVNSQG